ncbi:MAG: hypothetical protein JJU29_01415 [Verrucomicrobia bacterium]|nr:hypothetical protein [Verrucomicrobiota bacterium]MCH8511981.1 hypothetical protein [Kiritimatiellia bacterium]
MKCLALLPLFALTLLQAEPLVIYPSSDNRVLDTDGSGHGNESRALDHEGEALNIGDNANDSVWRSILKFDLREQKDALADAEKLHLRLTVRQRLLQTPRDWTFQVLHIPSEHADRIVITPTGDDDEFSRDGKIIHEQPAGTVRSGEQVEIDITDAVKAALAGNGILALRLQLDPATNKDKTLDQISFFSGSHNVNTPSLRPQIIVAAGE